MKLKKEYNNNLIKKYPEAKYIFKLNGYKEDENTLSTYDNNIEYTIVYFDIDEILKYDKTINIREWDDSPKFNQMWKYIETIIESAINKYGIDNMKYEYGGDLDGGPLDIRIPNICSEELSEILYGKRN